MKGLLRPQWLILGRGERVEGRSSFISRSCCWRPVMLEHDENQNVVNLHLKIINWQILSKIPELNWMQGLI